MASGTSIVVGFKDLPTNAEELRTILFDKNIEDIRDGEGSSFPTDKVCEEILSRLVGHGDPTVVQENVLAEIFVQMDKSSLNEDNTHKKKVWQFMQRFPTFSFYTIRLNLDNDIDKAIMNPLCFRRVPHLQQKEE